MRATVINISELQHYMELKKHEELLVERIKTYLEYDRLQKEKLASINKTALSLIAFKNTPWWVNIPLETKRIIERYSR